MVQAILRLLVVVLSPLIPALPLLFAFRWIGRRERRWKGGQCVECGYDLTGNQSGVCPECGRRVGGMW